MKNGFSLVELSIVLVILGLLTGGILAGQSLIHAAELRKTATDIQTIRAAVYTFRDKYFGLPGDLATATKFWGAADGGDGLGTDCYTANNNNATTCNGDSDGKIAASPGPESYRFWQQLVNAGLYAGSFSGVPGTPPYTSYSNDVIGTNIPRSPLNANAGIAVAYWWSDPAFVSFPRQNTITIATCCWSDSSSRATLEGPSILAEDLWNIDTKLDDGKPGFGNVQIYAAYGGSTSASAYDLASGVTAQPLIGMGL